MNRALGTPYEISLRIQIMLAEAKGQSFTIDRITALDFMAVYANDFRLSDSNLHGHSSYRFGEFAGRRELVRDGLKILVLNGTVNAGCSDNGFVYSINQAGTDFVAKLESAYAFAYKALISKTLAFSNNKSDRALVQLINRQTVMSLQEG